MEHGCKINVMYAKVGSISEKFHVPANYAYGNVAYLYACTNVKY